MFSVYGLDQSGKGPLGVQTFDSPVQMQLVVELAQASWLVSPTFTILTSLPTPRNFRLFHSGSFISIDHRPTTNFTRSPRRSPRRSPKSRLGPNISSCRPIMASFAAVCRISSRVAGRALRQDVASRGQSSPSYFPHSYNPITEAPAKILNHDQVSEHRQLPSQPRTSQCLRCPRQ